jgi:hypothetical protein
MQMSKRVNDLAMRSYGHTVLIHFIVTHQSRKGKAVCASKSLSVHQIAEHGINSISTAGKVQRHLIKKI